MLLTYWNCGTVLPPGFHPTDSSCDDLPPEYCQYRDEGCRYSLSCLRCPYPFCLQELPEDVPGLARVVRDFTMIEYLSRGYSRREVAERFRVNYRTVLRLAKRYDVAASVNERKGEKYDSK